MAHPGLRRTHIIITDAPGMRISAETVTPVTVVLLDTRHNSDARPIATAVTIAVLHHPQDAPVTEAGSGVQRPAQQLIPALVTVIQGDSRGLHGGLVLRTGIAVQQPSWKLLPCQGARPPAVPACLVIRDCHSRRMNGVDVVQRIFRYLRLRPHAGHRLHIDLDHPAMVRNVLCTCLRSLQIQFNQQTWRHGRMARQRLPTRHSLPIQQRRPARQRLPTRHRRPTRQGSLSLHMWNSLADPAQQRAPAVTRGWAGPAGASIKCRPSRGCWPISVRQTTKMYRRIWGATLFPSIPKLFNQMQLLDFIAMMNLPQQKGEPRDVLAGPATVSSPRTVVRKSPSPLPAPHARDRTPERSRSPVRKSRPTTRTDRYSFEGSDSSSRSRSSHSSRSPDRCRDSPLDFRAAIQSEEIEKTSAFPTERMMEVLPRKWRMPNMNSSGKHGSSQDQEGSYWISVKRKSLTECLGWTSLHCLTRWRLQPG